MTPPSDPVRELSDAVKGSWHRFLDTFEPLRPELYRYCRYLTRSPWDAEDLAQDALARAFVTLGCLHHAPPQNPRAWLFRVASNLWIDRRRALREAQGPGEAPAGGPGPGGVDPREAREAAGTLMARLSPQERAAVVLKDMFDLSLDEVAEALSTTEGAVKAALHRGRGKLTAPEGSAPRAATPASLDAFCAALNARDVGRMASLLLDSVEIEIVGVAAEYGPRDASDPTYGSLAGMTSPIVTTEAGGVSPEWLEGYVAAPPRAEVVDYRGEPVLAHWYAHEGGEAVRAVTRVGLEECGLVRRVRNYFFAPDVVAEVCRELGLPFRTNGYRYW